MEMRGRTLWSSRLLSGGHWPVSYFPHGFLKELHPSLPDSVCLSLSRPSDVI